MSQKFYSLGLIGFPLGHSYSAGIHCAALREFGLMGDYRLFPVQPLPHGKPRLMELLSDLRQGRLRGLNVTIPWKKSVQTYLDDITLLAEQAGAVNTLFLEDGHLIGDNTDSPGFLTDLFTCFPNLSAGESVLILGAGGSAYSVAHALLREGWSVHVAARRLEQAEALKHHFNKQTGPGIHFKTSSLDAEMLKQLCNTQKISLIVNCTPSGMAPHIQNSPWPAEVPFPVGAAVYDLVYNPQETALVWQARLNGLAAVTGGGMLVEQAALAFERWVGRSAPRDAMRQAFQVASQKAAGGEQDR